MRKQIAGGGELVLTTDVASGPRTRTLHGQLRYRRGWRVRQRIEIDVTMWSADTAELAVRPLRRRAFLSWAARTEGRYFDVAHQTADRPADLLRPAVSVPRQPGADAHDLSRTADTSATDRLRPQCRSLH